MRWVKWILSSAALVLAALLGLLIFVQSQWAKDKIGTVLEEIALQQGLKLKIEKIEGELPLKWTLSDVHLQLNETDTIDIDKIRLRLSILPLLRKEIAVSYLYADKTIYRFMPSSKESPSPILLPSSFSIRRIKVSRFQAVNLATEGQATYTFVGSCGFKKRTFNLHANIYSPDLHVSLFLEGNKKTDQVAADLNLEVKSERAFAPFALFPFETAFHLETQCVGPWKVWKNIFLSPHNPVLANPIVGSLKLDVDRLSIQEMHNLDENLNIVTEFSLYSDRSLTLSSLILKSDLLCVKGNASLDADFFPKNVNCSLLLPHLSHVAPHLEGMVKADVRYTGKNCQIVIKSQRIDLHETSFENIELALHARFEHNEWIGILNTSGSHPELPFVGTTNFKFQNSRLQFQDFNFQAPQTSFVGDFAFDLPSMKNLSGGLSFQIGDLELFKQLSPIALAGQVGGQIDFQGSDIRCHAITKALKTGKFISQQVVLDFFVTDIFDGIKGKFDIETANAYLADIFLTSASYSMAWNSLDWTYDLKAEGDWKNPFNIASQGHFSYSPDNFLIHCDTLSGTLLQKNLQLEEPFTLVFKPSEVSLSDLRLKIDDGFVRSSFQISPKTSNINLQAQHFPLDFLTILSPRLSLKGRSSIDVALQGSNTDLIGHCNVNLEHADIYPAGSTTPIQTKASFQANLNHETAQVHTHIVATGQQLVEVNATLPLSYQIYPFKLAIEPQKHLAGQCTIEGHVEQLFDFINIGTQRFGGFLGARLILSGTLEKPTLFGPISIQNGFYNNYVIGLSLKNGDIKAIANGDTIDVEHVDLTDEGQGMASATAQFHLKPNLPFAIQGHISDFRVIRFNWLTATGTGPFSITGNLDQALAKGTINIDDAEIQIPDQLPSETPALPVTFINQPASHKPAAHLLSTPYPFYYDFEIHGDKNLHLTGRGIDAQVAGDLHITGKDLDVVTEGSLKTTKGKFSFSGKDFKITEGELSFTEGESFINLTGNLDLADLNVTVIFRGSFRSPQLIFQSNPPLSTSSILARILFNKDVSELNASQAGQLAYTIISLSGSSGPTILDTIHKNLGIDRLGISVNEETGKVSVQIGKYLTEGVMITLSQSTEQSHVIVEVELKGGFVLQAETQFNDQGKFIFKWNKNY
jgi:autotransporter translocation and assembly factor TamB